MVHAVTQSSEVEVPSCSKDKGKKTCFRWGAFMIDYISA